MRTLFKSTLDHNSLRFLAGGIALLMLIGFATVSRKGGKSPLQQVQDSTRSVTSPVEKGIVVEEDCFPPLQNENAPFSLVEFLKGMRGKHFPGSEKFQAEIDFVARFMEENPDLWSELYPLITEADEVGIYAKWALIKAFALQSDSVRAHAILLSLLRDPSFPLDLKVSVVSVLPLATEIPSETISCLFQLSSQESGLRGIAMEALARCSVKFPRFSTEIVRFLSVNLRSFLTKGDSKGSVDVISALGYTKASSETEYVRALTTHGCPNVRGAALVCLSRLDANGASSQVRHALRNDENSWVRFSALQAVKLPYQGDSESIPSEVLNDLLWTLRNDSDDSIREETLRLLYRSYRNTPSSVRDAVWLLADLDSSRRVRTWAKWFLEYGFRSS